MNGLINLQENVGKINFNWGETGVVRSHSSSSEKRDVMTDLTETSAALGEVFDAHVKHEFVDHDVDATMRTMVAEPYLLNVPTLAGGVGAAEVRRFYERYFVGKMPADTKIIPISRTVGHDQVVDELVLSFTHDVELEYLLPGIPPTGKRVELPHVVVVKFKDSKIAHEHIYWDQASLLVQVGLLDPKTLPAVGVEQARRLLNKSLPSNILMSPEH